MNAKRIVVAVVLLVVMGASIAFALKSNKAKLDAKRQERVVVDKIAVNAVKTIRKKLDNEMAVVGTVMANNDVMIVSETAGRVVKMGFENGDYVQAGQLLCKVDDELRRAGVMQAQAVYDQAKREVDRMEALFAKQAITAQQLEGVRLQLKNAEANLIVNKRQLADTEVKAPVGGIVTARMTSLGSTLGPGTPIANVVDINTLKVRVNVAENDIVKVGKGMGVNVQTEVYPGVSYPGVVLNVSAKGDEAHTYPVEIQISNSGAAPLKAGMFAKASFSQVRSDDAIVIPRDALVGSVKDASVFVVEGSQAKLRKIVVGGEQGAYLIVRQGLAEGDIVVQGGQLNLKDGANVEVGNLREY